MILIKKALYILFFSLSFLLIVYLAKGLGIIKFSYGLIKAIFPIFIALFISVCMESVISRFIKRGLSRKKATIISYLGLVILIILLFLVITPIFIKQLKVFIDALPSLIDQMTLALKRVNINFNSNSILDNLQIKLDKIIYYFQNGFSFIISTGIAFSGAFFISYDYDKIKLSIKSKLPKIIKNEVVYFFSKYIPFFSKYIYSLLIDSLITFIISFLLFTIFKIEYSLIGSLIITITNLIPFIGPLLAIIPLLVIGYSVSSYFAIMSVLIVLLVQLVESNIIQPLIFKNVIKLHPLEGLIGILLFAYLLGAIGMIFAPLLVVAFKILFIEKYQKQEVTF